MTNIEKRGRAMHADVYSLTRRPSRFPASGAGRGPVVLWFAAAILWWAVSPGASFAQETGTVEGSVVGSAGTPIAAVTVELRGETPEFALVTGTGRDGRFSFTSVPVGRYELIAAKRGYRTSTSTVSVSEGQPATVNVRLPRLVSVEQLIVTATRSEQRLGQIPSAVTAVEQEEIQKGKKAVNLVETLENVPGVRIEDELGGSANRTRIIVRGVGTRANNPAGSGVRGIRVLVDGIPKNNAGGSAQDLGNIDLRSAERIEIVRGPSSALYGNQSGGVINIITQEGTPEPFMTFRQTVGSYGLLVESLKTGGTTGDLSYFVSAYREDREGFREHSEFESTGFNSKFVLDLDERSEVEAVMALDRNIEESPGTLTREQFQEDPSQANPAFIGTESTVEEFRLGLTYRRQVREEDELQIRGYWVPRRLRPFDLLGLRIPQDFINRGAKARYLFAQELGDVTSRFTVGADYQDTPITTGIFLTEPGLALSEREEQATTFGVYAREEVMLPQDLLLTVAGRFDHIKFENRDNALPGGPSASRTYEEFSPKVGVTWSPVSTVSVYGNYSEAFAAPVIGELRTIPGGGFGFNDQLEPERTTSWEVGSRGEVGAGRLRYELAVYWQEIEDFINPVGTRPENSFRNVGQVDQFGVEFGSSVEILPELSAGISYTFNDFVFEDFVVDDTDLSDNELPGVPKHTLVATLGLDLSGGAYGDVELKWVDDFFLDNENTVVNESYTVLDARVGYEDFRGFGPSLSPFFGIDNVFDEVYSAFGFLNAQDESFFNPLPGTTVYGGVEIDLF